MPNNDHEEGGLARCRSLPLLAQPADFEMSINSVRADAIELFFCHGERCEGSEMSTETGYFGRLFIPLQDNLPKIEISSGGAHFSLPLQEDA